MSIRQDKIVLFGDSITQKSTDQDLGWALSPALQSLYMRRLDVVVRGYSGYTSEHAKYMIKPILDAENSAHYKVRLLVIFFGSNDATVPGNRQNVPMDRYAANIRGIAHQALDKAIRVIIVGPGLYDEVHGDKNPITRTCARFREYADAAKQVATELNVGFVDLFSEFARSVGWTPGQPLPGTPGSSASIVHLLPDGLHYSGAAYKVFYEALVREIHAKYPELAPEAIPHTLPEWDTIDMNDLPMSLWPQGSK